MSLPDNRIKELQSQLSEVNKELRIEDAAQTDNKAKASWMTSVAVIALIVLLTALLIFKTLSPTGYSVVNESQTPASEVLTAEQSVLEESAPEELTVPPEETATEAAANDTAQETVIFNQTLEADTAESLQNETIGNESFANETLNVSVPEANESINLTLNETVNETLEILQNESLNLTLNETLQNETIANESFATNETWNASEAEANVTTELNITPEANVTTGANVTPAAGEYLPEELEQGAARVGLPVSWTKRVMVNWTGGAVVTAYLPKEAENITVYEAASAGQQLTDMAGWEEWHTASEITRNELPRSRYRIYNPILRAHEVGESYETGYNLSTDQQAEQSQTPAIVGFSVIGAETGNGLIMRFLNWLDSLFGIGSPTGAAVVEDATVRLSRPKQDAVTGRNINFLYRAGMDYDRCELYFDSIKVKTDELVIAGLNYFTLSRLDKGQHTWYVACWNRASETRSETWRLTIEDPAETPLNATLPNTTQPNATQNFTMPAENISNINYYETETEGAIIVNITDTVLSAPKVYEITYTTPGPEMREAVKDQYVKTVSVTSNISYQNVTAYTSLPGVPAWMVKLNWLNMSEPVNATRLVDSNNDGLVDGVEWTIPHMSEQAYEINLTYEIRQVNITTAEKRADDHTYEENVTVLAQLQDGLFTPVNRKPLHIVFQNALEANDTVSVYAWSNKDSTLKLLAENTSDVLSTVTLKKGEWNLYNLTITGNASASTAFDLYPENNVKFDHVTAYDKKALIPKKIVPLGNNLTLVLTQNETVDVTSVPQFEPAEVTLKTQSGAPVAEFEVFFENSEMDIDLTGLVAEQDPVLNRAVIHMDSWPAAISAEKTLFIPSSGKGAVYICPNASTISEVNQACPNKLELMLGEHIITTTAEDNTTTTQNITVSPVVLNGEMLYKVTGLTGTGGGESITVLNVKSYPSLYGNWTVMFNTTGTANLTITPISGTTFTEFLTDNAATKDDLEFMELTCGNVSLKDRIIAIADDETAYNYSQLTENDSVAIKSVFIEAYSCNEVANLTNLEWDAGHHYILFQFGEANATAENDISAIVNITLNTTTVMNGQTLLMRGHINLTNGSDTRYAVLNINASANMTFNWYRNSSSAIRHPFRFPIVVNSTVAVSNGLVVVTGQELVDANPGLNISAINISTLEMVDPNQAPIAYESNGHKINSTFRDVNQDGKFNLTDYIKFNVSLAAGERKLV
jgi:hypothetical protein